MNNIAINIKSISKRYRIGLKDVTHHTFTGKLFSIIKSPVNNFRKLTRLTYFDQDRHDNESIWALKDINLEIKKLLFVILIPFKIIDKIN